MWLRHLLSIAILPFTVAVLVPLWIARRYNVEPALGRSAPELILQLAGLALLALGLVFFTASLRRFATEGHGTLAPWDPPGRAGGARSVPLRPQSHDFGRRPRAVRRVAAAALPCSRRLGGQFPCPQPHIHPSSRRASAHTPVRCSLSRVLSARFPRCATAAAVGAGRAVIDVPR